MPSERRIGWVPGWGGNRFFVSHRSFRDVCSSEIRVEFSPGVQGEYGTAMIGAWLRSLGVRIEDAWCERVDVAFDERTMDRRFLRLDPGPHRRLSLHGVSSEGPETETVGHGVKGWAVQEQLYDKQAERVAKGAADPGQHVRFEVRRRKEFRLVGMPEGESLKALQLRDLPLLEYPGHPATMVRRLAHGIGDSLVDHQFVMAACTAWCYGTAAARAAARAAFGWDSRHDGSGKLDQAEFVLWPEVEPSPRVVFDRAWGGEAFKLLAWLKSDLFSGKFGGA